MQTRVLSFDAIDNVRDYGGYGAGGRRLRSGLLLRSAHHARASDEDLARLSDLGLCAVVDLRRLGERTGQPSRRPAGFSAQVIESDDNEGAEAPHLTFLRTTDLTEDSVRDFMLRTYRDMPFDARLVGLFRRYFDLLAAGPAGAVLIHCAAGKDRTGLLAALTHRLLGVGEDDVLADYLLTNTAVRLIERAPAVARQIEAAYGRKVSDEAVVAFLGVEPGFLAAAFASIAERSGSVDAYLDTVLGVDFARREAIASRLLEP